MINKRYPSYRDIQPEEDKIQPQMLGNMAMCPFPTSVSGPRSTMFSSSHITQMIVHDGTNKRRIRSGYENKFGQFTDHVSLPENCTILAKINKRKSSRIGGKDSIDGGCLIIYEGHETGKIGCVETSYFTCSHPTMGFKNWNSPILNRLSVRDSYKKGTVLQDSPNKATGEYHFGREANVVFLSHAGASEDGYVIGSDIAQACVLRTFETATTSWDATHTPLNLYGTKDRPKIFPDIGEHVGDHQILMGLRKIEDDLIPALESPRAMMRPDMDRDELEFVHRASTGKNGLRGDNVRVVNVDVQFGRSNMQLPDDALYDQLKVYYEEQMEFYRELEAFHQSVKRSASLKEDYTDELRRLIVYAQSMLRTAGRKTRYEHKNNPLPDFSVTLTYMAEIEMGYGHKITDSYGSKGVNVKIVPQEDMPYDEFGHKVDIIGAPEPAINREATGKDIEQYINASARDFTERLRERFGLPRLPEFLPKDEVKRVFNSASGKMLDESLDDLFAFMSIVVPYWMEKLREQGEWRKIALEYLEQVLASGFYLINPALSDVRWSAAIVHGMEANPLFKPNSGRINFKDADGVWKKTEDEAIVGSIYYINLEKIADDISGSSSVKTNTMGIVAKRIKSDSHRQPFNDNANRALGEADTLLFASEVHPLLAAELHDRTSSPTSHMAAARSMIESETPTDIPLAVDRRKVPLGNSAPVQILKTTSQAAGIKFVYEPFEEKKKK